MNKKIFSCVFIALFLSFLIGCAANTPYVIKTYNDERERSQIAILRTDKCRGLSVTACDGLYVNRGTHYILLKPGQHEIGFTISGATVFVTYRITNKKYIDAVGGRTYILKSKGGGILFVGDKWFPEVIDVTDDANLHVAIIPQEIEKK